MVMMKLRKEERENMKESDATWQQGLVTGQAFEGAARYWLDKLSGELEPLQLPSDRPRPAERTFRGAMMRKTIPLESLAALKALCHEKQATLYAGICAVLRMLFYRYTGQRDFVLGTAALGRSVPELDDQIGYYVNTLALRDAVTPGMRFRELLQDVQGTLVDVLRHRDYPFERVVRDVGVITEPNRNALVDVMIMMDPGWGDGTVKMDGLEIVQLDVPSSHSKVDLTLFFKETPSGLEATIDYATDLFDADRIGRLLEHFETLMAAVVETADGSVDTLPLLPAHERERTLVRSRAESARH